MLRAKAFSILFCIYCCAAFVSAQEKIKNSVGIEFVLIHAGSFMMGADRDREKANDNELPKHKVTISKPFYLGVYEVTQAQWVSLMGENPSYFKDKNNPVESVSWNEVQEFIVKLNGKEGVDKYRLPTEAEWEYAARAGGSKIYGYGDDPQKYKDYGWMKQNSGASPHNAGQKLPNAWGLYDVYGNVFEWVNDLYADNYNIQQDAVDPKGASYGSNRVFRGGSWFMFSKDARVALRSFFPADSARADVGFRLAMSVH